MNNTAEFNLGDVFEEIKRGDFHASNALDLGDIPLISCSAENNGTEGYFKIPPEYTHNNCVTIASDGKPLTSFFHKYNFAAKDNVAICIPKKSIKLPTLLFTIVNLNKMRWRFSYGRKCYINKLQKIKLVFPIDSKGNIDQKNIKKFLESDFKKMIPTKNKIKSKKLIDVGRLKGFQISSLFKLERGDFHSISDLTKGKYPTVSRVSDNNGIVGYFNPPKKAKIYPKRTITISTVAGDSFVQLKDFIATDNVVMCIPKLDLETSTLLFISSMLNKVKWRYSYGRQCYKSKLKKTLIYLPVNKNGEIDEKAIEKILKNTTYWETVKNELI